MNDLPSALLPLRDRIEGIDRQIVELLAERMTIVDDVAAAKLRAASPLRDREREELLLSRLRTAATAHGIDPHHIERLYRVVLDMSVARQEAHIRGRSDVPLRVYYQGVEGAYSHLAAQSRYSGRSGGALLTGVPSFHAAATAVTSGLADLALLPIENSTAGSINETYDLLAEGLLTITGEVINRIEHCLLALPSATLAGLRAVRSHPQALAQCAAFFAAHPHLVAEAAVDTAGAAEGVLATRDPSVGAIASAHAGNRLGLSVLARGIQTVANNSTRFVEVSRTAAPLAADAQPKTSLLIELADRPGALADVLRSLSTRGLSLTKLESRPTPSRAWHYRFYVDVLEHAEAPSMVAALAEMAPLVTQARVLGTYAADPSGLPT